MAGPDERRARIGTMMAPLPTFADFYQAIHGRAPFPWQERLARRVAETNEWPDKVGVPTGLGKTACLDIAVWWLAAQADHTPSLRTAPTRIWWVVNRRLLVDSTHEHAERLARILAEPDASELSGHNREVIATVAHRLRSLSKHSWVVRLGEAAGDRRVHGRSMDPREIR